MVIDVCLTFFAFSTEAAFFPKRGGLSPERPSSTSTASPVRVAAIQKVSSAGIDDETPASLPLEFGQGGLSITWLVAGLAEAEINRFAYASDLPNAGRSILGKYSPCRVVTATDNG